MYHLSQRSQGEQLSLNASKYLTNEDWSTNIHTLFPWINKLNQKSEIPVFFNLIIGSQSLSLSPTWDSATWTDSTFSPSIRFTSCIRILCLCLSCRRNRLFSKRDIIMNRSSSVAPESCWTTLIMVPRALGSLLSLEQVRRPQTGCQSDWLNSHKGNRCHAHHLLTVCQGSCLPAE